MSINLANESQITCKGLNDRLTWRQVEENEINILDAFTTYGGTLSVQVLNVRFEGPAIRSPTIGYA